MIVGDVKQSIYRWRSGDWRLLNDIEGQFASPQELMDIKNLGTNYRSQRTIIHFNNIFFRNAVDIEYAQQMELNQQMASQLKSAYEDVEQGIPDWRKEGGLVNIQLLPAEDYQQNTLECILETVKHLREEGAQPNDMAILVRNNASIPVIAQYFLEHMPDVRMMSDEAFRLDSSASVCTLIHAIRLLLHPDDQLTRAQLIKAYQRDILGNTANDGLLFTQRTNQDDPLPQAYLQEFSTLLSKPLYELAEYLYLIFQLERMEDEGAYICTFFDCISDFVNNNTADIESFIKEWDETICKKTIQSIEQQGIRLISIHKSKGLEFDHVIIPYCDWQLEKSFGNMLWCKPEEEPFNLLPIVPVDYSQKGMMGTIYEKDYLVEHLQNTVDNLNLLYVAFTRACRHLFVIGKRNAKNTRSALIEMCLPLIAQQIEGAVLEGVEDEKSIMRFEVGALSLPEEKRRKTSENIFLQPSLPETVNIQAHLSQAEFRQSNQSKRFVMDDMHEDVQDGYIQMGNILHNIFSTIRTTDDIDRAIFQMQSEGILFNENITTDRLTEMIRKRLSDPRVADWFSHRWQVFNECSILSVDEDGKTVVRRPDRVMKDNQEMIVVDFKFGKPKEEYREQILEYIHLLNGMGYPQVKGYLWYVYINQIVEIR